MISQVLHRACNFSPVICKMRSYHSVDRPVEILEESFC